MLCLSRRLKSDQPNAVRLARRLFHYISPPPFLLTPAAVRPCWLCCEVGAGFGAGSWLPATGGGSEMRGAHEELRGSREALVATSLPCSGRGCVGWLDLGEMRDAGRLQ